MPLLSEVPKEYDPTHLLLIGDTKMGKSTYAAQCARDGFHLLYVDSDNGISALRNALGTDEAAMKRIQYIRTNSPCDFLTEFFDSPVFRWNLTQDKKFSSGLAKPTDEMVEIIPSRMPRGIILVNDSWTSTALDAMEIGAENKKVELEAMGEKSQNVYGDAGMRLTLLLTVIQHSKFNCIVLAHGTFYERMEKPTGVIGEVKQKDMILKEVLKVPLSSSRVHGYNMGKHFTDIGWLDLNRMNERQLDFTVEFQRIGGGRPNKKGPIGQMSFKNLFGEPLEMQFSEDWIRHMTTEQWLAANKTAAQSAGGAAGSLSQTPAKPVVSAMMVKK